MGRFLPARPCAILLAAALLTFSCACNRADQAKAKQDARELEHKISQAVGPVDTQSAQAKLRKGGEELRSAGEKAGVKLDRAALVAKTKTKLVSDIGLSSATAVNVDAEGGVVTLTGTVSSEDQKRQAEESVRQVDGVSRVINRLTVKP